MDSPENRTLDLQRFLIAKMAQTYRLSLLAEDLERYLKILLDTGLQRYPFEMVENWINDLTPWLNMDYSDI